jgi:integrase
VKRLPTAREIERITKRGRHACGHGLYLQVSEWNTRSWIFRYRRGDRARHVGLGSCTYVTLAEARERAFEYRRLLARGGDPLDQKHSAKLEQKRAAARAQTFEQTALQYIAAHEGEWRGDSSRSQWLASLQKHAFPKIGSVSVADVTVTDVISVLDPIARAIPETAKRVKDRIAKVLDWAYARDLRSGDNPARRPNLLPKNRRAKVHFAAMAYPALPAFLQELRQLPDITARALELLILTAARPNEVLGARWGEIDLASAMWTIPGERMKSGKRHRVPLSGRAVELLAALPRESDYVFMGRFAGTSLGTHALRDLLRRRMGHNITTHGFRASFRTWAGEQTAYPRELFEVALAHKVGDDTEEAYNRGDMLMRRRRLMEDFAEYCSRPHIEGDVVPLRAQL